MESFVEFFTDVNYSELTIFQQASLELQLFTYLGLAILMIFKR